jgi:GNAT superfamily N-acetyltransferase
MKHLLAQWREASGYEDYGGRHRPDSPDEGSPTIDHMQDIFPDDVYEHPDYYGGRGWPEAMAQLRACEGKPNQMVNIYRACPKSAPSINNGDWVTTDRSYAQLHGDSGNAGPDWHILKARVPARTLYTGGNDVNEWGYWGPDITNAKTASAGAQWQITHRRWTDPMQWPEGYPADLKFSDDSIVYEAKLDGEIIGYMRLRQRDIDGVWFVWRIETRDPWKRQGVATALIEQARHDLGRIDHSPESERTPDGLAWSHKVGAMYHWSPRENRESIEESGLRPGSPDTSRLKMPTGVYLFLDQLGPEGDVYAVEVDDRELMHDPLQPGEAFVYPGSIPPDRVRRIDG